MTTNTGNEFPPEGGAPELSEEMRELAGALRDYTSAADRLTTAVEVDGRRRDFWTKIILVVVTVVVLLVLFVVFRQNASSARGVTIQDCVVPGGDCYARVQAQRRADFERQTLLAVAVASCGQSDPTHLDACVHKAMAAADTPNSRATPAP